MRYKFPIKVIGKIIVPNPQQQPNSFIICNVPGIKKKMLDKTMNIAKKMFIIRNSLPIAAKSSPLNTSP